MACADGFSIMHCSCRGTHSVQTALIDAEIFCKRVSILEHIFPGIAVHTGKHTAAGSRVQLYVREPAHVIACRRACQMLRPSTGNRP